MRRGRSTWIWGKERMRSVVVTPSVRRCVWMSTAYFHVPLGLCRESGAERERVCALTGRLACGQVVPPRGRECPPGDQAVQEVQKEENQVLESNTMRSGWMQQETKRKLRRDCSNMVNWWSTWVPRQFEKD